MKYICLLFTAFIFSTCSKDEGYGAFNLKEGQEVELQVSHRFGAINDFPLLLPQNESPQLPLSGFDSREAGYSYRVKAKMVAYKGPQMMDGGPGHSLQFLRTISREKYEGNESFEISLIQSPGFGTPILLLSKEENKYWFVFGENRIQLTNNNEEVERRLNEIWQHLEERREAYTTDRTYIELKWSSIRATVTHSPEDLGKAYLVSHIELVE